MVETDLELVWPVGILLLEFGVFDAPLPSARLQLY
jgi:hypothetical protein